MTAIRGFLRNSKPATAELIHSLNNVLAGIARCTVDGRDEELSTFRESMLALASHIHEQAGNAEVDEAVTHALELLRDFNEHTLKNNSLRTGELKTVMRAMTETITFLSESRTRSVHQLQFMERELEQASEIDDIRILRTRLMTCLDVVREETIRMQAESQTRSQEVRQQIDSAAKVLEPPTRLGSMDNVTGLPARRTAETAIREVVSQGSEQAISVFVVSRLSAINAKYGRAVGDEVMLRVANHFAQHLSSATFLYRWSGPALVALIHVENNSEEIRRSWTKAAAVKQEISLEANQRSVFVMVETAMSFQLVGKQITPDELFMKLDKFVAEKADGVLHED